VLTRYWPISAIPIWRLFHMATCWLKTPLPGGFLYRIITSRKRQDKGEDEKGYLFRIFRPASLYLGVPFLAFSARYSAIAILTVSSFSASLRRCCCDVCDVVGAGTDYVRPKPSRLKSIGGFQRLPRSRVKYSAKSEPPLPLARRKDISTLAITTMPLLRLSFPRFSCSAEVSTLFHLYAYLSRSMLLFFVSSL
jgi:hypothetical protein